MWPPWCPWLTIRGFSCSHALLGDDWERWQRSSLSSVRHSPLEVGPCSPLCGHRGWRSRQPKSSLPSRISAIRFQPWILRQQASAMQKWALSPTPNYSAGLWILSLGSTCPLPWSQGSRLSTPPLITPVFCCFLWPRAFSHTVVGSGPGLTPGTAGLHCLVWPLTSALWDLLTLAPHSVPLQYLACPQACQGWTSLLWNICLLISLFTANLVATWDFTPPDLLHLNLKLKSNQKT